MKMPPDVSAYIDAAPPGRAERLRLLGDRILGLFPGARVSMRYRMPTFEAGESWIAIANQKHYVSVYTCARHHIESYLKANPATKAGTGCLNFPDRAEIDLKALDAVIDSALNAKAGDAGATGESGPRKSKGRPSKPRDAAKQGTTVRPGKRRSKA